jgi:hypothetical protein
MRNVFIFDYLIKEATRDQSEPYVLFGLDDFASVADKKEDFLFHGIEGLNFDLLEEHPYFRSIPLLPNLQNKDHSKVKMYELNSDKPFLDIFALRSDDEKFLDFYNVSDHEHGKRIKLEDVSLHVASVEECSDNFTNWDRIYPHIIESRTKLDNRYSSQAASS